LIFGSILFHTEDFLKIFAASSFDIWKDNSSSIVVITSIIISSAGSNSIFLILLLEIFLIFPSL